VGCQTPTGSVLRVLAPLDGSGRARGTHEPLAEPAVRRVAPTLCGLVSCRSRPWSHSSEPSPLEEPYPLSRAFASVRVRVRLAQRRGTVQGFRGPFRLSRRPLATAGLAARRTEKPGRRFPGVARASRVTGCPVRVRRSFLGSGRARRTRRPTRPLRSLAPLESPFSRRPVPGQGWWAASVGALLSLFPSRAFSSMPRVRSSRERTWSGASPCPVRPREPASWPLVFARSSTPAVGSRTHGPLT